MSGASSSAEEEQNSFQKKKSSWFSITDFSIRKKSIKSEFKSNASSSSIVEQPESKVSLNTNNNATILPRSTSSARRIPRSRSPGEGLRSSSTMHRLSSHISEIPKSSDNISPVKSIPETPKDVNINSSSTTTTNNNNNNSLAPFVQSFINSVVPKNQSSLSKNEVNIFTNPFDLLSTESSLSLSSSHPTQYSSVPRLNLRSPNNLTSGNNTSQDVSRNLNGSSALSIGGVGSLHSSEARSAVGDSRKIDKTHEKFAFMYHMLTGIRLSVSRGESKEERDLMPSDFKARHKLMSDITGSELEPSQRYDFKFKDYCPIPFRKIRSAFGLSSPEYLNSLTGKYILSELFSPGKSKSYLYFSHDYRYIIKTIHSAEKRRLLAVLPDYVDYVLKNPSTLLARYYGLHRMKTPSRKIATHFVVMSNVFPPHLDMHLTFDLKGSLAGREVPSDEVLKKGRKAVLKDMNWLKMEGRKLWLGPLKRKQFVEQLEHDVLFLMAKNIMDYSLLIGVHDESIGNGPSDGTDEAKIQVVYPQNNMAIIEESQNSGLTSQNKSNGIINNSGNTAISKKIDLEQSKGIVSQTTSGVVSAPEIINNNEGINHREATGGLRLEQMRRALRRPEITQLETITSLQLAKVPEPLDGVIRSVFFADDGGYRATDSINRPLEELYFMSIIDILTPYDAGKRVEHVFKSMANNRHEISAVPPREYGRRFVEFMKNLVGEAPPEVPPEIILEAPPEVEVVDTEKNNLIENKVETEIIKPSQIKITSPSSSEIIKTTEAEIITTLLLNTV